MNTHIVHKNFKTTAGFTLVELVVTITLIAVLSLALINIDFGTVGWVQKEERLTQSVIALIRDERIRMISWKGILASNNTANLIFPSETRITLSQDIIKSEYLSGSIVIWTGSIFTRPFFGESGYSIEGFSGSLSWGNLWITTPTDSIIISYYPSKDMIIQYTGAPTTGCVAPPCNLLQTEFTTGFNTRKATITVDSRSGVVQKK